MTKAEIHRKFDEIVTFAEIEKFLDTPVKRYSSGMYVRLAFAVAAHMEPEILIVDEVLAVGDAAFQKKCLAKMEEFARSGHTVLFVSHSMQSISKLCNRVIYIADGKLIEDGPADEVIKKYIGVTPPQPSERVWSNSEMAPGNDKVKLLSIRLRKETQETAGVFTRSETIMGELRFVVLAKDLRINPHIHVFNQ